MNHQTVEIQRFDLIPEIQSKLIHDYGMKTTRKYLEQGQCPMCGQKTFWTWKESPWHMQCNRQSKCAYEVTAKALFPELWQDLSKRHPASIENKNATADAYIQLIRGLPLDKVKGLYKQGSVYNTETGQHHASIRFFLNKAQTRYWERVIDSGTALARKANFGGKRQADGTLYAGKHWQPVGMNIVRGDTVYITEGILDCLSLWVNGYKAVAALTCGNFPEQLVKQHKHHHIQWIYALDNDTAGRKFNRKHIDTLRKQKQSVLCALPGKGSEKVDWNDLHRLKKINALEMQDYHYWGAYFIAKTAIDRALLMYHHEGRALFTFPFRKKLYGFDLNTHRYEEQLKELQQQAETDLAKNTELDALAMDQLKQKALKASRSLSLIANCVPEFLYTQQNPITDELFYFIRIIFPDGRTTKNTMTGTQLATTNDFRKRMLSMASGAIFKGTKNHHENLLDNWMSHINEVETVPYVGYEKKYDIYVYPKFAVKDHQVFEINQEEFIQTPTLSIKSLYHTVKIHCNLDERVYQDDWFQLIVQAWGYKAIVALAFFVGSLFVQQIRAKHASYPFLELVGDPGTGKTTLISFLWQLFGREGYEGINPRNSKGTTAFMARAMAQISNLPMILIEGDNSTDKHHKGAVDWSDFKDLYNGRGLRGRGMKTQGNETYEPDFKGALVIAQNFPVDSEAALLERIVQCYFKASDNSLLTLNAVRKLAQFKSENVSYFLVHCLKNQKKILHSYFEMQPQLEEKLLHNNHIRTQRLTLTYSQIMAMTYALQQLVPITQDQVQKTQQLIKNFAETREIYIKREHPIVEQFFEVYQYIEDKLFSHQNLNPLNHHTKDGFIAIRLNEYYERASEFKQPLTDISELKSYLRHSERFIANKNIHSAQLKKVVSCWVFRK